MDEFGIKNDSNTILIDTMKLNIMFLSIFQASKNISNFLNRFSIKRTGSL